jgi:DtxR family transcriptional regulator, Mn-dependent transcriptional regulator
MTGITQHEQDTAKSMSSDLSSTMRDYLAEIYRLAQRTGTKNGYVTTSALAELLDVSAPAVNRMVTKLKELNLLHHEPYQGIALTDAGKRQALIKLRRHRIAETFLVSVMGFGWHEVHAEADRISSAMSEAITQRMLEMAGQPTHCPHGEPIPDEEGNVVEAEDMRLADAEDGQEFVVTRILTRDPERLEYMEALGLLPGREVQVLHVAPFHGPMQLKLGGEYRIIGHNLGELIRARLIQT